MAEIKQLFQITTTPGIRRDGTNLDSDYFPDGQWVRWQRGRVKKMGGYRQITGELTGPVRAAMVWSRSLMNALHTFSPSRIEATLMNSAGVGGSKYDRTPSGFVANDDHIWSVDTMYDDAVGSNGTIIIAVATNSLANIDDPTKKQVYYGLAGSTDPFLPIAGLEVSGGICAIAPYLVYYGSDGQVGWSDVNQPQTLNTGDAGQDRVTGSKIVKALPLRTGTGPGALLWSLDSLIAMQWVGGDAIFRFSTVSTQTSILSQNSVLEYDGNYFWAGVDRFMVYSGGSVMELPNDNNLNWFFDNLRPHNRQKVWATKIPRYGEIWWFFPFGDADECTHAVIYNLREKTWYDCELSRSSGYYSQVFTHPVMVSSKRSDKLRRWTISGISGGGDPYWDQVLSAFNFHGASGLQDLKSNAVTVAGDTHITTDLGGSALFDGAGDYLGMSSALFNRGTGPWTIEGQINYSGTGNQYPAIVSSGNASWSSGAATINCDHAWSNGKIGLSNYDHSTSSNIVQSVTDIGTGNTVDFAIVRDGTSIRLYIGGVLESSATVSPSLAFNWNAGSGFLIGGGNWDGANSFYNGYVKKLRFSDFARYTSNYTPVSGDYPTATGTNALDIGDTCTTVTSKIPFTVVRYEGGDDYQVEVQQSTADPIVGEGVIDLTKNVTGTLTNTTDLYSAYTHEVGKNAIEGDQETAIESYFETCDFGFPTGGPQLNQQTGINRWARLVRVEPDFLQVGDMTLQVVSREFAQAPDTYSDPVTFTPNDGKIDMRVQGRQIRLRFASNTRDGSFEMGRVILHVEPGDIRS